LTVSNNYGSDTVKFDNLIEARTEAPIEADIQFVPFGIQQSRVGDDIFGKLFDRLATSSAGPWTIPPQIRATTGQFIEIVVPTGIDANQPPTYTYAGEKVEAGYAIDPVITYTWSLEDDLPHPNSNETQASYSVGGIYDLVLRVDTYLGAYRITTYSNTIDIIENTNLWLFNIDNYNNIKANEFGIISETFKVATRTYPISRDSTFLDGNISDPASQARAIAEFNRDAFITKINNTTSGNNGSCLLAWASGGASLTNQTVNMAQYLPYTDVYTSMPPSSSPVITRPWNFIMFNTGQDVQFLFGTDDHPVPNTNSTYQVKDKLNLTTLAVTSVTLNVSNYLNGAEELLENPTNGYNSAGDPTYGGFSVYRSSWKDNTGYFLRNSAVGDFFRISNFYSTVGTVTEPIINIKKLPDMPGIIKTEGQLVTMSNGLFFFNNSGVIAAYNDTSGSWEVGTSSTVSFRTLQDTSVSGFDSESNTLLASSDGSSLAYLSFDYSDNAFIKYNGIDLTFTKLSPRPSGTQWVMGVY
jgi:hypothetical protein